MVDSIARGVITKRTATFYEDNGNTPQYVVGGVSYVLTAFNNMVVATGIAEQDQINLATWKVTFSIPVNAPITTPGDFYTLLWKAKRQDGGFNQQIEKFAVIDQYDNEQELLDDGALIVLPNQAINVSLRAPAGISNMSLLIVRAGSNDPVITLENLIDINGNSQLKQTQEGNYTRYHILLNDAHLTPMNAVGVPGGLCLWYAYFNYIDNKGGEQTIINPIYMVNNTLVFILDSVNQYINLLKNTDVVKQLMVTESKLIHFAIQGLLKLNSASPGNFGFDFNSLARTNQFTYWVIKCAQLEFLNALYLAEGMSAFEFSGMTVQLNSDRTQYIAQAIATLESDISQNMSKVKSQWARAGGGSGRMGAIMLNIGPASNIGYGLSYGGGSKWNGNAPFAGAPSLPFLNGI